MGGALSKQSKVCVGDIVMCLHSHGGEDDIGNYHNLHKGDVCLLVAIELRYSAGGYNICDVITSDGILVESLAFDNDEVIFHYEDVIRSCTDV